MRYRYWVARLRIPDLKAGYYQNIAAHFYKTALSELRLKAFLPSLGRFAKRETHKLKNPFKMHVFICSSM